MTAACALVAAQARAMVRDRTAVVFLLVLPVAIMVVLGNVYAAESGTALPVAVRVEAPGPVPELLVRRLQDSGAVRVVPVGTVAELDDLVRRGEVRAGLVVPPVEADGSGHVAVQLVGAPDVAAPIGVRRVVDAVVAEVGAVVDLARRSPDLDLHAAAAAVAPSRPPVVSSDAAPRRDAAVATLVLVTFMNLIAMGSLIPTHRRQGVLARLAAAPVTRRQLAAGYLATFAFVGLVQVAVALVAGRLLLGIDWGPPATVGVLAAGLAAAAGAVGVVAGTLLPSPESGSAVGGPIGFVLGMIGGCLWPLEIVGRPLQVLGRLTPHAWVVDGLRDAGAGRLAAPDLVAVLGVLAATAVVTGAAGAVRLARSWS